MGEVPRPDPEGIEHPTDAELFIKQRHVRNCSYADPAYGRGVARALGISYEEALVAEDPAHPAWDKRKMRKKNPVAG